MYGNDPAETFPQHTIDDMISDHSFLRLLLDLIKVRTVKKTRGSEFI